MGSITDPRSDVFDVIVVGSGNAALCAALSAHEAGARVLVLDAAPKERRGGNSRYAGTVFRCVHSGLEQVKTILCDEAMPDTKLVSLYPYTNEDYTKDMRDVTDGRNDPAKSSILIEKAWDTMEWMKGYGVKWELVLRKYYNVEGRAGKTINISPGVAIQAHGSGIGLMNYLFAALDKTNIEVHYDSPVHDLITSGDTVSGVQVRKQDVYQKFYGSVVLASGGFSANPAKRRQYLGEGWDLVTVRGTRYNTGTPLFRAIDAGAQPCGHWGAAHASPQDIDAPLEGDIEKTPLIPRYSYTYGISVNTDGKRFFDEGEGHFGISYAKTGKKIGGQPGGKAYQIFDQKTIHLLQKRYSTGRAIQADTLGDLARKLGISVTGLLRTVEEFNAACPGGEEAFDPNNLDGLCTDKSLAIPKSNWSLKIEKGPFVAYGVVCGITFTYGGIETDTEARVINTEGKPMPGLWATGEIAGGVFYHNYPGGAGLVKGSVFGRIAGKNAFHNRVTSIPKR